METKPAENENVNDRLVVRINEDDMKNFKNKTGKLNKPYQVMIREMVKAFNDDRLKIIPTDEQKESLKVYQE